MSKQVAPKAAKCTRCGQIFDLVLEGDRILFEDHFATLSCFSPAEGLTT